MSSARNLSPRLAGLGLLLAVLLALPLGASATTERPLNEGWAFLKSDETGFEEADFDDSAWRRVDLPHDWSVEDLPPGPTIFGPYDSALEQGNDVGRLRGGTGWYRHRFSLSPDEASKVVFVELDGVQQNADVWVNGHHLGFHGHGYTPFVLDLTPHLRPAGEANVLVVRAVNPEQNSRWYPGSGLYRLVTLHASDPLHIPVWGPRIETSALSANAAEVTVEVPVRNGRPVGAEVAVEVAFSGPDGRESVHDLGRIALASGEEKTATSRITLAAPRPWSPGQPDLYRALIRLREDGRLVDETAVSVGLRTLEWSATRGFLLNGEPILLKGGCVHHDNGLLGAAAFPAAEERRIVLLQQSGFNAVRTAHNPPSEAFLDAADRLGMLVIDEFVDMWVRPKRPNDYSNHFKEHWQKDLADFVRRDRNHPSVVMWSVGNEVNERAANLGIAIGANLVDAVKALDTSRPVTNAICGFWDNPGWEWERHNPAFALLDIGGYNYQGDQYVPDHEAFSDRVMFGSESVPKEAFKYWQLVEDHPWVIGDFVWTAMDYVGEAGLGHFDYTWDPDFGRQELMPWPWWVSWCGDIDLVGDKKPQSLYRDVVWRRSDLEILVHAPPLPGAREVVSFWGWPDEEPHWTWTGHEGVPLRVNVYTRAEGVRLELDGRVVGEAVADGGEGLTATFDVPYAPGRLTAVALEGGGETARRTLRTTGRPAAIQLGTEGALLPADRTAVAYVPIAVVDAEGAVAPVATSRLEVEVEGAGELVGLGNASPLASGSLQDGVTEAFRGRALAIVRSTGEAGPCRVTVKSAGLRPATVELQRE